MKSRILCAFFAVSSANAALLVYDGFDSRSTGSLSGQSTSGATGLTGNYTFGGTVTGQSFTVQAGGLSFSTYNTGAGNSVIASSTGSGATIQAQMSGFTAVSGTLYSSYLINIGTLAAGGGSLAEIRAVNDIGETGAASRFRLMADASGSSTLVPAVGMDGSGVSGTSQMVSGTTYMVIGRFTNVGGALSVGSPGVATLFALTASQWNSFIAAGGTDAYLDAAAVGTGSGQISAKASETLTAGTFNFTPDDVQQTAVSSSSSGTQTYTYDDVKWGTSLLDVTTVPEPSAVAAALLSAAGFAFRRRR